MTRTVLEQRLAAHPLSVTQSGQYRSIETMDDLGSRIVFDAYKDKQEVSIQIYLGEDPDGFDQWSDPVYLDLVWLQTILTDPTCLNY